ncbi:MAG: damage-inducible protein DinB [Bacteroidetes bacterium]|nr:MAG: damage-inducible protein DinB [Bacteroidota bacterium]
MKILDSTMAKLAFIAIAIFTITAFTMNKDESPSDGKVMMIADWKWAKEYTLAYIESMPESGINFKPTDSVRSFAEQMLHITSANVGFTAQVTGLPPTIEDVRGLEKNESYKNKAALTAVVSQGYDYVIASLEATSNDKLNEKLSLFGQYEMTGNEAIHKAFIHQNHHRGQCAVYIRLAGGVPAAMKLL